MITTVKKLAIVDFNNNGCSNFQLENNTEPQWYARANRTHSDMTSIAAHYRSWVERPAAASHHFQREPPYNWIILNSYSFCCMKCGAIGCWIICSSWDRLLRFPNNKELQKLPVIGVKWMELENMALYTALFRDDKIWMHPLSLHPNSAETEKNV